MKMSYNTYNLNKFGKRYLHHLMLDQNKIILELIYICYSCTKLFKDTRKGPNSRTKINWLFDVKKTYKIHVC